MADTILHRLCQPITQTGWLELPRSVHTTAAGVNWQLRLFEPDHDIDILQGWTLSSGNKTDDQVMDRNLLVYAFREIAHSDDMQAFMILRDRVPLVQMEVVDANKPLSQVYIPVNGAYLLYIKNSIELRRPSLVTAIELALRFFFQFQELRALYLPCPNLDQAQIDALSLLGFIRTVQGASGSTEVMSLDRSTYEERGTGAGETLMQ